MTHSSTWKQGERKVAKLFGSERTPLSGGNSKHTRSDTLSPIFFVECKYRKHHAAHTLFRDTAELARREDKIPVVVLLEKGRKEYLVVFSSKSIRKALVSLIRIWAAQKFSKQRNEDE